MADQRVFGNTDKSPAEAGTQVHDKAQEAGTQVRDRVQEVGAQVRDKAQEVGAQVRDKAQEANWLQVFRRVDATLLGSERRRPHQTRAVREEKCVGR